MQPTPNPVLEEPTGLLIEPHDTLFCRDGRPFGPTDFGQSQLPTPQTIAGMLRTHVMHSLGLEPEQIHHLRENAHGVEPHQRALAFIACRGPWLVKVKKEGGIEDLYVPPPAHLCRLDKNEKRLTLLRPLTEGELPEWQPPEHQKHLCPLLYTGGPEAVEPESRYLKPDAIRAVLRGETPAHGDLVEPNKLFAWEERTGVTISPDTYTGEESLLYSTRHMRLTNGIALYAEIGWEIVDDEKHEELRDIREAFEREVGRDTLFPERGGFLPLGGEGRRVSVKKCAAFDWPMAPGAENAKRAFTWLISPVINYQHARTNGRRQPWEPMPIGKLVAAACPRPLVVSGWDMAGDEEHKWHSRPRPTRYAVPAGAVYFWERGGNRDPDKEWLPGPLLQLAENAKDRANGWGMALKGVWRDEK